MAEWQNIESAPKDGTRILVCQMKPGDYEGRIFIAAWRKSPEREVWVSVGRDSAKRKVIEPSGWWEGCEGLWPDFWQPLPTLPLAAPLP